MGLQVEIVALEEDEFGLVVHDALAKAGLEWPKREPEEADLSFLRRAYGVRALGEYCREANWPFPHMRHITCSCWQAILPFDFSEPIPMFPDKSPQDYDLPIPHEYGLSEEELERFLATADDATKWTFRAYPYYTITPASDIFLLSAPQLMREIESHLASLDMAMERREDGEWNDLLPDGSPHSAECAAYLYRCCDAAIRWNGAIVFWG